MGAFEELVQREIDQRLVKSTLISTAPSRVVEILENEMYIVQMITNDSRYKLMNYSGSSLNLNESVQIYYRGDHISSQSAYIGASLNKPNNIIYIYGIDKLKTLSTTPILISEIKFDNGNDTTVNVVFNAVINSNELGDYTFEIYIDGNKQNFDIMGTIAENGYDNCSFIIPVELSDAGTHLVQIYGEGTGEIVRLKSYIFGQHIFVQSSPQVVTDEDDYIYYLASDHSETISYISSYKNIIMPETLEELPLTIVGMATFSYGDIEEVTIPDGVTKIE